MSIMETALSLYSDIDKIKNKKTTLEKKLNNFINTTEATFLNEREKIFKNLLDVDNINNNKNKEFKIKDFKDINDKYNTYYKNFNKNQEDVTN